MAKKEKAAKALKALKAPKVTKVTKAPKVAKTPPAPQAEDKSMHGNSGVLTTYLAGAKTKTASWYELNNLGMNMNEIHPIECTIGTFHLRRNSVIENYTITNNA